MEPWWPPQQVPGRDLTPTTNMVIAIITSRYTSNSINERTGVFLAENQRFNVWFQLNKAKLSEERVDELGGASERLLRRLWTAWTGYVATWTSGRRPEADDYRVLITAFDEVAEGYRALRA
ncbi:hypothetical protein AB0A74_20585 [Saccharothrix sp. NPDC042600]|uniref:hypothetical protein n=1 Tax=Saccharothrix TaxID=2071 RepID=UPI0033C6E640|nr:hypothetical protein GCM10017745_78270 [Saccharothrix mutabilis subsp. capreolus]